MQNDPITTTGDVFPLGAPKGRVAVSDEPPSGSATRPFGMTRTVLAGSATTTDVTGITYDPDRQMATVSGGSLLINDATKQRTRTEARTREDEFTVPDISVDTKSD